MQVPGPTANTPAAQKLQERERGLTRAASLDDRASAPASAAPDNGSKSIEENAPAAGSRHGSISAGKHHPTPKDEIRGPKTIGESPPNQRPESNHEEQLQRSDEGIRLPGLFESNSSSEGSRLHPPRGKDNKSEESGMLQMVAGGFVAVADRVVRSAGLSGGSDRRTGPRKSQYDIYERCKRYKEERNYYRQRLQEAQESAKEARQRIAYLNDAHSSEIDVLRSRFDELYNAHVQSVNSIGTGLDPITDEGFKKKFREQHDQISQWCRRAFKNKGQLFSLSKLDPRGDLRQLLVKRITETNALSFFGLMESITWAYAEKHIFSIWFPGLDETNARFIEELEGEIRSGDTSSSSVRAEFWRAYTTSLLFQSDSVKAELSKVNPHAAKLDGVYNNAQINPRPLEESHSRALQENLRSIMTLAAELKCQRAVYEIDESVQVGDPYDETRMHDVKFCDGDDESDVTLVVTCILSKGWVRRPFAGSSEVQVQISKARVLIAPVRTED